MKEQTIENMMKGRPIFEPPRYMTTAQAAEQLMEVVNSTPDGGNLFIFTPQID